MISLSKHRDVKYVFQLILLVILTILIDLLILAAVYGLISLSWFFICSGSLGFEFDWLTPLGVTLFVFVMFYLSRLINRRGKD